jgi:hypothetical protein
MAQTSNSESWTKYMEWTNYKDLKKGEKYRIIFESYEIELIFCYYKESEYYRENCDAVFKDKLTKTYHTLDNLFEYYKIISKKEYNSKIREKFNEKVLNIVLKQIVNDDFKW